MGKRTKLWEIRGERQKRNQEIRNRMKGKNCICWLMKDGN